MATVQAVISDILANSQGISFFNEAQHKSIAKLIESNSSATVREIATLYCNIWFETYEGDE